MGARGMSGWNAGRGVLLPQTAPRSHCEPRLVLTCVRVSRTVVERARISAVLTARARDVRRALPAVRAAPAWRLVCYLCAVGASVIWLQRFFSRFFSQPDVRSSLSVGARRGRGGNRGTNEKCRMTCRQSCAGARDHERRITADLRRGVACRVRPAAGAPHARATHTS